jgi:hypothetical protein
MHEQLAGGAEPPPGDLDHPALHGPPR